MDKHTCKRCGCTATTLSNLKQHYNRKIPCDPVLADLSKESLLNSLSERKECKFSCDICQKGYTSRQGLYIHNKQNHAKDIIVTTKQEIAQLVKDEIEKNKQVINIHNINNNVQNNIQNNQNITINMKSFGFENISHLESDKDYMTQCLINKDVMGLIQNIHCDKGHPENHNVKIKSTKRELMETFIDGQWIISDQDETLDELLNKGYRILNFFSYRNKDHIVKECDDGEEEYHEMRDWLEDLYSNSKLRKPLKRKLLILFMNNKALFLAKQDDEIPTNTILEAKNPTNTILEANNPTNENIDSDEDSSISLEELDPCEAAKYTMYSF